MVLEIGVAVVAVCLPSIWMVFATMAPEAFLRSVHSLVSLASAGSRHSKDSQRRPNQGIALQPNTSTSSHIPISGTAAPDADELSIAKGDDVPPVPTGQIHVHRSVQQSAAAKKYEEV